jgi:hypothetical protein
MTNEQEVTRFVRSTFRSAWSVELLLVIKGEPDRSWAPVELVARLRASDLVVTRGLEELLAGGLILIDGTGAARYRPLSADLDRLVEETATLYAKSSDAVRRIIVSRASVNAFADAFRLRKD